MILLKKQIKHKMLQKYTSPILNKLNQRHYNITPKYEL